MKPTDVGEPLTFSGTLHEVDICAFKWNISTNESIVSKFGTDIRAPLLNEM